MVFWGVEVKPGKPYTHSVSEDELYDGHRLHLSQATLGLGGKGKERAVVKCKVGEGPELLLCSLIPGVSESCSLDLLFDQDVDFSVVGSSSVHLMGYYMPLEAGEDEDDDDYQYDELDSEEDSEDDEDDENESEMEGDDDMVPSGVTIEEIEEEAPSPSPFKAIKGKEEATPETPKESKKAAKKRRKEEAAKAKQVQSGNKVDEKSVIEEESEDEDGFSKEAMPEPTQKKQKKDNGSPVAAQAQDVKKNKKDKTPAKAAVQPKTPSKAQQPEKTPNKAKDNGTDQTPAKTPAKTPVVNGNEANPTTAEKAKSGKKGTPVRKFPNGLEIEDVAMGKPDAKQAKPGKRVGMFYTGKLKSNGKIFDSNIGKKPFEFRLGVGEVIKGWDVGVNGMRIGDKRKLTIPAQMAYGAKGVPGTIPGNATLLFDVELVNVK